MIVWKSIEGYSNYVINQKGEVMNVYTNRILKQFTNDRGYVNVHLSEKGKVKTLRVHRLVAEMFRINPDNKPEVNHIDGNKLNNHHSNLEWVTKSENMQHAFDNGLGKNTSVPVDKFTKTGEFICSYESMTQAAKDICGSQSAISNVCKGNKNSYKGFIWKFAETNLN